MNTCLTKEKGRLQMKILFFKSLLWIQEHQFYPPGQKRKDNKETSLEDVRLV